eukprot:3933138-Pyramimonas_sp.AAC.1
MDYLLALGSLPGRLVGSLGGARGALPGRPEADELCAPGAYRGSPPGALSGPRESFFGLPGAI